MLFMSSSVSHGVLDTLSSEQLHVDNNYCGLDQPDVRGSLYAFSFELTAIRSVGVQLCYLVCWKLCEQSIVCLYLNYQGYMGEKDVVQQEREGVHRCSCFVRRRRNWIR